MAVKFTNNAVTTLTAGISAGATQFVVASNSGFPTVAGSDYTYLTVGEEVVKVTGISGTTFTCDATSSSHANGSNVELRMTAELLTDFATDLEAMPKTGGTFTGDIDFGDNVKAKFGASDDLQIYHDGSNSVIKDNGTGNLIIRGSAGTYIQGVNGESCIAAIENAGAHLYFDGSTRFKTTATGVDVTGAITTDGLTTSADISFGDNVKAKFGTGADLQIYHDGSHSYVDDVGTGNLFVRANNLRLSNADNSKYYLVADDGGFTKLLYNNATKLATTATGIDVTGSVSASSTFKLSQTNGNILEVGAGADKTVISNGWSSGVGDWLKLEVPSSDDESGMIQINSNGKVGIGTSSPSEMLEVGSVSTSNNYIKVSSTNNTAAGIKFRGDSSATTGYDIGYEGNGNYLFFKNDVGGTVTERLRIQASGDVGIGTTAPAMKFAVSDGGGLGVEISPNHSGGGYSRILNYNRATNVYEPLFIQAEDLVFYTGSAVSESMRINSSGNVGIGTSSPDTTVKLHVQESDASLPASSTASAFLVERAGNVAMSLGTANTGDATIFFADTDSGSIGRVSYDHSDDSMTLWTSNTEKMRIDSSGKVGIGTSSPSAKLQVAGADLGGTIGDDTNLLTLSHNNGNGSYLEFTGERTATGANWMSAGTRIQQRVDASYMGYMQFNGDGNNFGISFGSNSTERMRIDSSGNVGIGTSSPTAKLHIIGNNAAAAVKIIGGSTNGYYNLEIQNSADNGYGVAFKDGGSIVGSITTTGSATSYNTSSDYRLKENVDYTWDATTRLKQLKPARFNFIEDDTNTLVDGFIAHEVSSVVPEAIHGTKDAMMDEEYEVTPAVMDGETVVIEAVMGTRSVPDMQGIDQSKLVPLLVKTIQELEARITALEA